MNIIASSISLQKIHNQYGNNHSLSYFEGIKKRSAPTQTTFITLSAANSANYSLHSILNKCQKCGGQGSVECPGCKGTGKNKKNGNIFERWKRPPFQFLGTSSYFVCSTKSHVRSTEVDRLIFKEKKISEFSSYPPKILNRVLLNSPSTATAATGHDGSSATEMDEGLRNFLQAVLWIGECIYVIWLFLLPYAPGDPVWAISSDTIKDLVGLSLNFFFILPLSNSVCVHLLEAPVLHPMSEGLFNFVIGWTLMFAPLLYTDFKRNRFQGSLDILWSLQMFLTNTFLIPYMAIRLNNSDLDNVSRNTSKLGYIMINGASVVGLIGGTVCVLSVLWALFGRGDANFGSISERIDFLRNYIGSERLAYAFVWDIVLYTIFQPWLIGDNLKNIQKEKVSVVNYFRFVPVVGLIAYCLSLNQDIVDK